MDIEGLTYIENFISAEEAALLVTEIDKQEWQTSLKRRVQQYGPVYDYTTKRLKHELFAKTDWLASTLQKINDLKLFSKEPEQVIINEYTRLQGISRHIDSPLFGPVVASLSLGEKAIMTFGQYGSPILKRKELGDNSLLVLSGEARNNWWHCIPDYIPTDKLKDPAENFINIRERRVSITLRTVLQMPQPTS